MVPPNGVEEYSLRFSQDPRGHHLMIRSLGRIQAALLTSTLFFTPGCCAVAEYFCGPDESEWVPISFETPDEAIETLVEALRRDHEDVLYRCLGEAFKRRVGLGGGLEWSIAWGKIKDEIPGIHLMGNGRIEGPERTGADRVRYVISRAGYEVAVDLERVAYWEIQWDGRDPSQRGDEAGEFLPALRRPWLDVSASEPGDPQKLRIDLEFESWGDPVRRSQIRRAGVGHEWKVFDLAPIDDSPSD